MSWSSLLEIIKGWDPPAWGHRDIRWLGQCGGFLAMALSQSDIQEFGDFDLGWEENLGYLGLLIWNEAARASKNMGFGVRDLDSNLHFTPLLTSCAIGGKWLNISESHFHHLQNHGTRYELHRAWTKIQAQYLVQQLVPSKWSLCAYVCVLVHTWERKRERFCIQVSIWELNLCGRSYANYCACMIMWNGCY